MDIAPCSDRRQRPFGTTRSGSGRCAQTSMNGSVFPITHTALADAGPAMAGGQALSCIRLLHPA